MAKGLNVVFQTHWDREWYLTFEEYRHRLVFVVKRVVEAIDNNEIDYFVLDGQVAAVEDLLEVCEVEFARRFLSLIKENKIIIGPWYVLADEFLVTGESLVRNLEIGISLANQYGRSQKVGYLPDTFGHISQIPQLLKQFNIDNAIIWRGVKPKQSEFIWQGADKSQLFTIFLPEGYYQPILDQPNYLDDLVGYIEKVKSLASTSRYLLTNGGDHLMPSRVNLSERRNIFQKLTGEEITITNFEQYISQVKAECDLNQLEVIKGELRGNDVCYVLPNVLSSRSYLKLENQRLEDELTGYVEPLNAIASYFGGVYPMRYLEESWKLLLLNHPHDSICGCSIDEVHQDMMARNRQLSKRLNVLQTGALNEAQWLAYTLNDQKANHDIFNDYRKLIIFNPHPSSYSGVITSTIYLLEDSELNEGFELKQANGNTVSVTILNQYRGRSFNSPTDYFPEFRGVNYYEICFNVNQLKGNSLTSFELVKARRVNELVSINEYKIENDFVSVEVNEDGTLTVLDKLQNKRYDKINQFYSSMDAGDEYNYSPPQKDCVTFATLKQVDVAKQSEHLSTLEYTVQLVLPQGLDESRDYASSTHVTTTVKVMLSLSRHQSAIDVRVKIDNQANDQRLRVRIPLSTLIDYTYSDSGFDIVKRDANRTEVFDALKQKEVPVVVDSSLSFVIASSQHTGFVFYHRGLHEFQISKQNHQSLLDVTLIRSVGWLSRPDFRTRGGGAGPMLETKDAQMIGQYEFEYGLKISEMDDTLGKIQAESKRRRIQPKLYRGSVGENDISMFEINNLEIAWSSIRKHRDTLEVRLYNPTEERQYFSLSSQYFSEVEDVMLNGQFIQSLNMEQEITIQPKCIKTLRLK